MDARGYEWPVKKKNTKNQKHKKTVRRGSLDRIPGDIPLLSPPSASSSDHTPSDTDTDTLQMGCISASQRPNHRGTRTKKPAAAIQIEEISSGRLFGRCRVVIFRLSLHLL